MPASHDSATPAAGNVSIRFDGAALQGRRGSTVAATLVAAGEQAFRESADGRRGLYCGMGVCQECLVTIDGVPGQRACTTVVRDGMQIERQPVRVSPGTATRPPPAVAAPTEVVRPQVLVIGGGPAGLTAAATAAEAGARVVLLDERPKAGGQFFKQPGAAPPASLAGDRQLADGRRLIERAERAGVEIRGNTVVWGGYAGPDIRAFGAGRQLKFRPAQLVVATGACERGHPVPGWTLPGVMTTGAAQTLLKVSGAAPPGRIFIAGNGPLNLQVALELARAGANVVGVAEQAPAPGPGRLGAAAGMLLAAPRLTAAGLGLLVRLRAMAVPVGFGRVLARVEAAAGGLRAALVAAEDGGSEDAVIEADTICLGYGFLPDNELLRLLGCDHAVDRARGQLVTRRDEDCRTSVANVFAIGDCTGMGGAAAAQAEGVLAGLAAARACGIAVEARAARAARRALARHRRFQAALWRLFAPAAGRPLLTTPATTVCRCENVTAAGLDAALAAGCRSIGAIKRETRLGMGPCQGRYCVPVALERLAARGIEPGEFDRPAPRPPLRPLTVAELGAGDGSD